MISDGFRRLSAIGLIAAGILAGQFPGVAMAQTAPDSLNETYGAWSMQCSAGLADCHVVQALTPKNSGKPMVRITLFRPDGKTGGLVLRALTPLGTKLRPGAVLEIDGGSKVRMPFAACLDRGCLSETPITPAQEVALRTGKILAVMVVVPESGKTIRFELALDGAGPALDRMSGL